jgi:hypothetical protein
MRPDRPAHHHQKRNHPNQQMTRGQSRCRGHKVKAPLRRHLAMTKKYSRPRLEIETMKEPFYGQHGRQSLLDACPMIAIEWCFDKNWGWGPEDVTKSTKTHVWWTCPKCETDYKVRVDLRTGKRALGCPKCTGRQKKSLGLLKNARPDLYAELHPMQDLDISKLAAGSAKKVHWLCSQCGKDWHTKVYCRSQLDSGCPFCYRKRLQDNWTPQTKRKKKALAAAAKRDKAPGVRARKGKDS